jgi:hypothetical protein
MDTAKERYHIAKLALFNVRLMDTLQNAGTPVAEIVAKESVENGMNEVPSLLHQGTFLQFSYTCLVWLWESAKIEGIECKLLDQLPVVAERLNLQLPKDLEGERRVQDWKSVIRLVRNALGHGRVEISDTQFIFADQNTYGKNKEQNPTKLRLTWEEIAKLSEAIIHSLTPILWPEPANKALHRTPTGKTRQNSGQSPIKEETRDRHRLKR